MFGIFENGRNLIAFGKNMNPLHDLIQHDNFATIRPVRVLDAVTRAPLHNADELDHGVFYMSVAHLEGHETEEALLWSAQPLRAVVGYIVAEQYRRYPRVTMTY